MNAKRTQLIAGNWKMNNNMKETAAFIESLEEWFAEDATGGKVSQAVSQGKIEIVIAPTYTSIYSAVSSRRSDKIEIAAQNAYYEAAGAFTGEISLDMLEETGCKYVILGHSERRHIFNETNELLEKKLSAALKSRVLPIFCIGELLEERESGNMKQILGEQLKSAWKNLNANMVIAYEPVWAIGTGKTASNQDAEEACGFIRTEMENRFGAAATESLRILYGGSVKADNSADLLKQKNIDGLLIGGASLKADSFQMILKSAI